VANESTSLIFSVTTFTTGLDVSAATLALGAAAGLGAAVLAGWTPARHAAGVSPLAAVRAASASEPRWPPPPLVAGLAGLTAVALWVTLRTDSAWSGNVAAGALDALLVCGLMRAAAPLARAVLRPLRERTGFAGRLAIDRLVRLPNALALAAAVLALGLGIMIMAGTLARSFEESVLDFIRHQVRADLVVAST